MIRTPRTMPGSYPNNTTIALVLDMENPDVKPPTPEWTDRLRRAAQRRRDQMFQYPDPQPTMPDTAEERKERPLATGLLDYFPEALAEVSRVSWIATKQHHSGKPMHWERHKSSDHADTIMRHLADRGLVDSDGVRHSAKVAWRALALLQEELEAAGANPGRASIFKEEE